MHIHTHVGTYTYAKPGHECTHITSSMQSYVLSHVHSVKGGGASYVALAVSSLLTGEGNVDEMDRHTTSSE